jgi:retron-type reverse transcriptase
VYTRKVSKNYTKQCYILKCDIRKFFASIDHSILLHILEKRIQDEEVLELLRNIIGSFPKGLPLGNLTSQLLVNIYMNEFDQYVKHILKVKYYIRYADDFVFIHNDKEYLEGIISCHNVATLRHLRGQAARKVEDFLTHRLKLTLHPNKVFITTIYAGMDFLGWIHFPHHRVLRAATKKRVLRKVSEKNMTSYLGLLRHGGAYTLQDSILKDLSTPTN